MRFRTHAAAWLVSATLAVGCATRPEPRLIWEGQGAPRAAGTSEWAADLVSRQPGVRAGAWGTSDDATFQLIEARVAERPHVHQSHDLTVVLLRGRGVLRVEGREYAMAAGDVVHVGHGRLHYFHPAGSDPAIALAIFSPRLSSPDYLEK